jgi:hypothetical protein
MITMASGPSTLGDSGSILIQTGNARGKSTKSYDPSSGHSKGEF